jgi:hypothetical protein
MDLAICKQKKNIKLNNQVRVFSWMDGWTCLDLRFVSELLGLRLDCCSLAEVDELDELDEPDDPELDDDDELLDDRELDLELLPELLIEKLKINQLNLKQMCR